MRKRILSMILCVALLLTVSPTTVWAAEEMTTIYFENTANWSVVYAYGWGSARSANAPLGSWPGTSMTLAEGKTDIYAIEVPAEADKLIFNNGAVQTTDLTIPTDGKNLFILGAAGEDGKYTGTWSTYGSADSEAAQVTGVSITVDGKEYTSGQTAAITLNSAVYFTVTGTNLDKLASSAYISYAWGTTTPISTSEEGAEQITISVPASDFSVLAGPFEVRYNLGAGWLNTGLYVQYDTQGKDPKITGVKLTVDDTVYTEGTAVVRPGSSVTITLLGENLNQISSAQGLNDPLSLDLTGNNWVASEDGRERSATYGGSLFESFTTRTEIVFTNNITPTAISTYTGSGVYAVYCGEGTYLLTFDTDGGSAIDPILLERGDAITAPAAPTKTGYTFKGWDPAIPQTMPAKDMNLHAVWLEKQTVEITGVDVQSFTWDGTSKEFAVSGTSAEGCTVSYCVDGEWTSEAPSAVGTYDVKITRAEDDTYKAFETTIEGGLVITRRQEEKPAAVFASPDKLAGLVAGAPYAITAGEMTYDESAYGDESGILYIYDEWCGKTISIVKKASDENRCDSEAQMLVIPAILTGNVTVSTASGRYTVGETLNAVVTDTNNTGTLSYQWYRLVETLSLIDGATDSSYTITEADVGYAVLCFVSSDAHVGTLRSDNVSILKTFADGDITVTGYTGVYDGKDHSVVVNVPEGAAVYYGTSAEACNSTDAPVYRAVGEDTVYYRVEKAEYESVSGSAVVSITPKPVTITADDKEAYVGSRQPELTYTVDGLVGSDALTTEPTLTADADLYRAGTYDIIAGGAAAGSNYSITYVNGTLTVKHHPIIPSDPTYPPVVNEGDNGDVSVSPRKPERGDTVVITPDPDAGYEVDKVIVTDKYGSYVKVIDNGNGTYSFKQPAGRVNIKVTFREFVKLCPGSHTCPMYGYTDLDMTAWYHDGIHYCIGHGLMQGVSSNRFDPNGTTTRAMLLTILWRLEGCPVVNDAMDFEDVAADQWHTEAIRWAASEKLVEGYGDGTFGTDDAITREQLVTILFRYAKHRNCDVSVGENTNILSYDDAFDVADWAISAMQWACGSGMLQGIAEGNRMNLAPQGNAVRAQTAAILQRYCENVANVK